MSKTKGRPPGKPTFFWTKEEKRLVREHLDVLLDKMPHRTERAIIGMMLRMESGEIE